MRKLDFEAIYEEYFHVVYLYMKSLTADESVAEEMTQEAFFKALKSIDKFDGSKDIRAWLFTIAKNTYFTFYKKQKRHVDSSLIEQPCNDIQFVNHFMNEEDAFIVHQFLHQMAEPYKEVFSLRTFGELPFERIGQLFGKSAGWARVTFYRARKQIMDYMEGLNHEGY